MFPLLQRMFPPRLNDATVHGVKVCAVRVAYESDANIYGVRRQAQRDAALDGVPLLKFAGKTRKRGKAASRFACRRTPYYHSSDGVYSSNTFNFSVLKL